MKRLNKVLAMTSVLLIGLVQAPVYANGNSPEDRIVGLWDVQVALHNCMTGLPIPGATFLALHQYHLGGTGQVVPNSDPTPASLSAHMTIWEHINQDDYQMKLKMYRFNPEGAFIGWVVIDNQVSIDKQAMNYSGTGVAEFFDAAGNYQFSSCPVLVGTRFEG